MEHVAHLREDDDDAGGVPLDVLHVVGGVEPHPPVLAALAPALLVLVLKLLKLLACNINGCSFCC